MSKSHKFGDRPPGQDAQTGAATLEPSPGKPGWTRVAPAQGGQGADAPAAAPAAQGPRVVQGWSRVPPEQANRPVAADLEPDAAPRPVEPSRPVVPPAVNIRPTPDGRLPCVGLPVQYHEETGTIPAVLQAPNRLDPALWDLTVFPRGTTYPVKRISKAWSQAPRAGCWGYLPGWAFAAPAPSPAPDPSPATDQAPPAGGS
jgi:hypothetical protein